MREIHVDDITKTVRRLCTEANFNLPDDVLNAVKENLKTEKSETGKNILQQIIKNAEIASTENKPLCQDTGYLVSYVEMGQDVHIKGGNLEEAVNEGIRQGYKEGFLRKSIVCDPLNRVNTKDNTPGIMHLHLTDGDKFKIMVAPKGGGCENMSFLKMLKPADGLDGVRNFVLDSVSSMGGNPCPPIVLGVGIGGTMDQCAAIAKKAMFRPFGNRHPDPFYADLEVELLKKVNKLGIGPQGLGGNTTALELFIEVYPCHIASLPVAVNTNCHSARHKEAEL